MRLPQVTALLNWRKEHHPGIDQALSGVIPAPPILYRDVHMLSKDRYTI